MFDPVPLSPDQLIRFYIEAGADEAIGDAPVDRFNQPAPASRRPEAAQGEPVVSRQGSSPPPAAALPMSSPPMSPPAISLHAIPGTASHVAMGCRTLAELREALENFDGLPWKSSALNTVFADGDPDADLMVIGEAPGQEEDVQGLPFVGRSGKLLDRMLASIGLSRAGGGVYITNILPWRPLENRKPSPDEVAVCLPFLIRHIELAAPKVLLMLGASAASGLLARSEGITRMRGQWFEFESPGLSSPIAALASFHPAYLLRTPEAKREAWHDLLMVKKRLDAVQ
jgi:DNA polymerase